MKKKVLYLLVVGALLTLVVGCNKKENKKEENKELNNGEKLAEIFKKELDTKKNNVKEVATKISESEVIGTNVDVFELTEDEYIAGFKTEIKDYKGGYGIRPMIGSIPFVAYIFETDKPEELEKTLKKEADLRWNICTEADILETAVKGNYVFITMIPNEF